MVRRCGSGMVHRTRPRTADRKKGSGSDPNGPAPDRTWPQAVASVQGNTRCGLRDADGRGSFKLGTGDRESPSIDLAKRPVIKHFVRNSRALKSKIEFKRFFRIPPIPAVRSRPDKFP